MLFLLFQIGDDRYTIEARQVVEVLPMVNLKHIPRAPACVIGVFSYHGIPVPLIDLTELALGKPSSMLMSTRIILTHFVLESGEKHLIGFLAEQVMETMQRGESDFVSSGVTPNESSYLGAVAVEKHGIIQRIDINRLLPPSLEKQLFRDVMSST